MDSVKIVVRGCAWCHFAQRVEGTDDLVRLYCNASANRQIVPPCVPLVAQPREVWRFYPSVDGVREPSEEEAYGVAPEWCPLRGGPISVELETPT